MIGKPESCQIYDQKKNPMLYSTFVSFIVTQSQNKTTVV